MTTDLTTNGTTDRSLADYRTDQGEIEGLEGIDARHTVLARWQIVQPTSQMDGSDEHIGQFWNKLTGEFRRSLDVVILAIVQSRVKFPPGSTEGGAECVSRDGVTGSVYGACNRCRFNWNVNPDLRARKGAGEDVEECHDGFTLLLVDDLEAMSPAVMGVKSTAVRPVEVLFTILKYKRKMPPWHCLTTIGTAFQTNKRGKFYTPTFALGEPFAGDELATWRDVYQACKSITRREEAWSPDESESPDDAALGRDVDAASASARF